MEFSQNKIFTFSEENNTFLNFLITDFKMDDDLESEGSPPSCPQLLEVTAVEATSATLKWKEPKKDGGVPIKEYVIEFKSNNEGEEWQEREDRVKPKKYLTETVSGLAKATKYQFRVRNNKNIEKNEWLSLSFFYRETFLLYNEE